jgi:hypothetical protein
MMEELANQQQVMPHLPPQIQIQDSPKKSQQTPERKRQRDEEEKKERERSKVNYILQTLQLLPMLKDSDSINNYESSPRRVLYSQNSAHSPTSTRATHSPSNTASSSSVTSGCSSSSGGGTGERLSSYGSSSNGNGSSFGEDKHDEVQPSIHV